MTPEELESENQKLKATLIDCRAEYLLFLDENPNAFAWDFDELSREAQDRYRKDARESLEIEEPLIAIQLREAETKIAELDDAVSGHLKNITKMLETVNADTIFSGIIQTWKNENGTLKTRITELEVQVAALQKIAIKEKASGLFNGPWDSGLPDDCGYDAEIEACRTEARRQLAEEHPEAFQ